MKVKCSNCGKKVPFSGNVCPWCNADKSEDKTLYAITFVCAVLGGIIAGFIFSGLMAVFIGGFVGAIVGSVIAGVLAARKESHEGNAGNPWRRKPGA